MRDNKEQQMRFKYWWYADDKNIRGKQEGKTGKSGLRVWGIWTECGWNPATKSMSVKGKPHDWVFLLHLLPPSLLCSVFLPYCSLQTELWKHINNAEIYTKVFLWVTESLKAIYLNYWVDVMSRQNKTEGLIFIKGRWYAGIYYIVLSFFKFL